jgi:hypothetical protein
MTITKRSICGPTRRSGERCGVRAVTQITPKQITAAMATPIQGEYSPNISAPRILRNYLRRLLTQLFTLKSQIVVVKQKQSSPGICWSYRRILVTQGIRRQRSELAI